MGERLLHIAHLDSANPTSSGVSTAKKDAIIAICFVALLCRTGADVLCKPDQITLTYTGKVGYQCLDCPTCPPGSQPSVPCGSTIENWTAIHCVPCPLGKAFSDNYDKAQCAACSVCSTGKAVLKNCTRISNSKCSKCRKGYYYESFSFACKPCAECCGDGNDEFVKECERYDHKCQVRPTPCSHTQTTPLGTTTPTGIVPTTQETHLTVMYNKKTTGHRKEKDLPFNELKSSLKPTQVDYKAPDKEGEFENAVGTEISYVIILFAVVAVLCIVVLVLIILRKLIRLRLSLRHPREVDSSDVDNYSSHGRTRSVSNQSQSSDFASPLLHPAALSNNNSSTIHQQNGLAPNALMESGISLSREPASPFQVGSESSLPNHPEPHRPLQSEPSQSEATEVSGSTSPLHILTDSSEKTGLSPLVGLSKEAPTPNPSNSSEPNQGASSLTSACRSTHFREPESSHPGHCDSPQADLHSVSSYPTRSPSQGSRSASSQPSDSCSPIQAEYTCTSTTGGMTLEKLDENHAEIFDWMCMKLDQKRSGTRYDFESLAKCYKLSPTVRGSLKQEYHHGGSPSSTLMDHIKAKHPNLPIHQLIEDLEKIGRKDIAEGLKAEVFRKDDSSPTLDRSPRVNC